jgi:hypothetical protein
MAYNWSQSEQKWVASPAEEVLPVVEVDLGQPSASPEITTFGSAADVITMGTASDTISGG